VTASGTSNLPYDDKQEQMLGEMSMTRKIIRAVVGSDGVLHLPLGEAEANQEVSVTIEAAAPVSVHQE